MRMRWRRRRCSHGIGRERLDWTAASATRRLGGRSVMAARLRGISIEGALPYRPGSGEAFATSTRIFAMPLLPAWRSPANLTTRGMQHSFRRCCLWWPGAAASGRPTLTMHGASSSMVCRPTAYSGIPDWKTASATSTFALWTCGVSSGSPGCRIFKTVRTCFWLGWRTPRRWRRHTPSCGSVGRLCGRMARCLHPKWVGAIWTAAGARTRRRWWIGTTSV